MKDICRSSIDDRIRPALNMRIQIAVLHAAAMFFSLALPAQSANETPVGRWQTVSDVTGKNNGVAQSVESGGQLFGRLVAGANPAEFEIRLCD